MRDISAVVDGVRATWSEADAFPHSLCLRFWTGASLPEPLSNRTLPLVGAKSRDGGVQMLTLPRTFVVEPRGFQGLRPLWAPVPEEWEYGTDFALTETTLPEDDRLVWPEVAGPLLVGWCHESASLLGVALESDRDAWTYHLAVLFGGRCRRFGNKAVWQLPS